MNAATEAKMNQIVAFARDGNEIYPMFFHTGFGRSATVGAAIRAAKKRNLIEQHGIDGMGKPKYRAVMPKATHAAPAAAH